MLCGQVMELQLARLYLVDFDLDLINLQILYLFHIIYHTIINNFIYVQYNFYK